MAARLKDFQGAFHDLGLDRKPVIVHASLSSFGQVQGGAETVVEALVNEFHSIIVPAFTYKTMLIPMTGPPDNGITYGSGKAKNCMAEFYRPDMPVDPMIGIVPEALRRRSQAHRSNHPILSFAALNDDVALSAQTLEDPFAPIGVMEKQDGWVLLLGVDHTVNTSIHYAEKLAGRRQFIRWALTTEGVRECPSWPGCSSGFNQICRDVGPDTRQVELNSAIIQAVPLKGLLRVVAARLEQDPLALLCKREDCERCQAIRIRPA